MQSAKCLGRDHRRSGADEASDVIDARGLNRLGEAHVRQDGGESACQYRLAHPWRTKEEDIMGRTPAYHFASPVPLGMPLGPLLNLLVKLANKYGVRS